MEHLALGPLTMPFGNFALTGLSGAAATHSSSAMAYAIAGVMYSHSADSGVATPGTDAVSGKAITLVANQAVALIFGLDASDNTKVLAGPVVALDSDGNYLQNPVLPSIPAGFCPCAQVVLKGGSSLSGTWTLGTSNWNATGLTVGTVVNLAGMTGKSPIA